MDCVRLCFNVTILHVTGRQTVRDFFYNVTCNRKTDCLRLCDNITMLLLHVTGRQTMRLCYNITMFNVTGRRTVWDTSDVGRGDSVPWPAAEVSVRGARSRLQQVRVTGQGHWRGVSSGQDQAGQGETQSAGQRDGQWYFQLAVLMRKTSIVSQID